MTALDAPVATAATIALQRLKPASRMLADEADMANLRSELKTDIANLKTDIAGLKTDVVRWIVTAIAFNFLGTVGLMVVVAKLAAR